MVNASSSAWVGCSWVPSPALTHAGVHPAGVGEPVRRTRGAVAHDDRVGAHRLERQRGVLERLALGQRGALGGEVDDVGREPLGGGLERDPGAGGVLEEQVDHGPAAQRRQLLDRPVGQRPHLRRGARAPARRRRGSGRPRTAGGASRRRSFGRRCPSMVTASVAVDLGDGDPDPLDQRGGEVLADEVGADRQLAVAAVDQHREPYGGGPADLGQRVERGPDRAAGEQHVVDEDDGARRRCRRCGISVRQQGAGRLAAAGRRGTW